MRKIGLISDTHSHFDPKLKEFFADVDEIWHAGDIGNWSVMEKLSEITPNIKAVFGNIDGHEIRIQTKEHLIWEVEGLKIWMTHIGGYPRHYTAAVKGMMNEVKPDIFICGHSHILRVMRDEKFNSMIVMNPGAAGVHGWHKVKTVLRFSLENKKVLHLEAIELGQRGKIENTEDPNEY
jgi:uncharacterized protein